MMRMRVPRRARRAASAAGWLVLAACVVPALLYALPSVTGGSGAYLVLSGSMEPMLSPGDLAVVRAVPPDRIAVGDVITYRLDGQEGPILVTHRVVAAEATGGEPAFRTRGDANEDVDPWTVHADDVVGRLVFRIPFWGLALRHLPERVAYAAFVAVPCGVVIVRELIRLYAELDAWDRRPRGPDGGGKTP